MLLRNFDAGDDRLPALVEPLAGQGAKVDWNNMHAVGSDLPGANWDYPEASYARRREIEKEHETYIRGFLWTLANNPRVPAAIRQKVSAYGLSKDEFTDNGGWPWMIYIREARRMVTDYVMTQHDCEGNAAPPIPSAWAPSAWTPTWCSTSSPKGLRHQRRRDLARPAQALRHFLSLDHPRRGECENLLSPICVSATHVAHGSIRMEPVFMALAHSAAIAAGAALDKNTSVQDVAYPLLRDRLLAGKQVLLP